MEGLDVGDDDILQIQIDNFDLIWLTYGGFNFLAQPKKTFHCIFRVAIITRRRQSPDRLPQPIAATIEAVRGLGRRPAAVSDVHQRIERLADELKRSGICDSGTSLFNLLLQDMESSGLGVSATSDELSADFVVLPPHKDNPSYNEGVRHCLNEIAVALDDLPDHLVGCDQAIWSRGHTAKRVSSLLKKLRLLHGTFPKTKPNRFSFFCDGVKKLVHAQRHPMSRP